jgi:hypothetical protein
MTTAFFYGILMHPKILKRVLNNDASHLRICPAILTVSPFPRPSSASSLTYPSKIATQNYTRHKVKVRWPYTAPPSQDRSGPPGFLTHNDETCPHSV